jgi:hypothetical protein
MRRKRAAEETGGGMRRFCVQRRDGRVWVIPDPQGLPLSEAFAKACQAAGWDRR